MSFCSIFNGRILEFFLSNNIIWVTCNTVIQSYNAETNLKQLLFNISEISMCILLQKIYLPQRRHLSIFTLCYLNRKSTIFIDNTAPCHSANDTGVGSSSVCNRHDGLLYLIESIRWMWKINKMTKKLSASFLPHIENCRERTELMNLMSEK